MNDKLDEAIILSKRLTNLLNDLAKEEIDQPRPVMEPAGRAKLLDLIGQAESGGNYNAWFRHAHNRTEPKFTSMTLGDVLEWQKQKIAEAYPSSAVGKYQFLRATLLGVANKLDIDDGSRFTPSVQDACATQLLRRRGLDKFEAGTMSVNKFANSLAKEWAALPVVTRIKGNKGVKLEPGQSYYAGDGLNKALVSVADIKAAIRGLR